MLTELPVELLIHILTYLQFKNIVNCLSTCKSLNDIKRDPLLWTDLLKYRFKFFYNHETRLVGPKYMYYNAELTEPIRKLILVKHPDFGKYMPDYSCSFTQIKFIAQALDLPHIELLKLLSLHECEPLEQYFLELNQPNNLIIRQLTKNDRIEIRYNMVSRIRDNKRILDPYSTLSNEHLHKIVYMHKLCAIFISFSPLIQKSILLSCLRNLDKLTLEYFMNAQMLQTATINVCDLQDCLPYYKHNIDKIIDILQYLWQYEKPIGPEGFTILLVHNNVNILQAMYERGIIKLYDMDISLLIGLCIKYVEDRNIEAFNTVREFIGSTRITGKILTIDGRELDLSQISADYTIALELRARYATSIYPLIDSSIMYKAMINTLFDLLNDPSETAVTMGTKLNLDAMDVIAILVFNNRFTKCDNIVTNHEQILKSDPRTLNLAFPSCNKLVAASLLACYIPPQNVINYCALNLSNIALLQECGYFQDKATNIKMKRTHQPLFQPFLLKKNWLSNFF